MPNDAPKSDAEYVSPEGRIEKWYLKIIKTLDGWEFEFDEEDAKREIKALIAECESLSSQTITDLRAEVERWKDNVAHKDENITTLREIVDKQAEQIASLTKEKAELVKIVDRCWKFDERQQPLSSWHDKQDCLELLRRKIDGKM